MGLFKRSPVKLRTKAFKLRKRADELETLARAREKAAERKAAAKKSKAKPKAKPAQKVTGIPLENIVKFTAFLRVQRKYSRRATRKKLKALGVTDPSTLIASIERARKTGKSLKEIAELFAKRAKAQREAAAKRTKK